MYHSFHDEVKLYKQHWWRCNGPCAKRPPYFGMVKRAMNRPPGPNDFWWSDHERNCGGRYIKVKEPEGFSDKKARQGSKNGKIYFECTYFICYISHMVQMKFKKCSLKHYRKYNYLNNAQ